MSFYGIFIPNETKSTDDNDSGMVFENMADVGKLIKKNRDARFKVFKSFDEAEAFSLCGHENSLNSPTSTTTTTTCFEKLASPAVGEKPSSFRGPTSQELVKFRKCIEQGKFDEVKNTIWSNPRYLISSGDTPTILKESFRYNALHVAAISKNASICQLILETVGDPKFIRLLHGKDDEGITEVVSQIMLDLYLNMPEKGRSETPLHLAAKFGVKSVVEVLTSYKECQMTKNSDGLLPKEIICSRNEAASKEVIDSIKAFFKEQFYVPVIRSVDNSMPPIIGEPFSPTQSILNIIDPKSPDMEIKAIAGPMDKDQAKTFQKRWKTPPRTTVATPFKTSPQSKSLTITNSSPLSSLPDSIKRVRYTPIKNNTQTNDEIESWNLSTEKVPRRLFDEFHAQENTNSFELKTEPEQTGTMAKHLFCKYRDCLNDSIGSNLNNSINDSLLGTPAFKERNLKLVDVEKGHEVIGRCLAKDNNIGWKEHWSFLDDFIDISSVDGLQNFENYLKLKFHNKTNSLPFPPSKLVEKLNSAVENSPMSAICRDLSKIHVSRDYLGIKFDSTQEIQIPVAPANSPNAFHSYLCVEKSCQVFAKRLLNPILTQANNVAIICDALSSDMNRLRSLVCSYKEDSRFSCINFNVTHSRFAHIIAVMLRDNDVNQNNPQRIDDFKKCLDQILQAKEKSQINQSNNNIINNNNNTSKTPNETNSAELLCLIKFLIDRLNEIELLVSPETLTTERDCSDLWASEQPCKCEWNNSSYKGNRSIKRRSLLNQKNNDNDSNLSDSQRDLCIDTAEDSNDDFLSLPRSDESDSDSDEFFTPPETPSNIFHDSSDKIFNYKNFIYGEEPTKADNDVFNALHDTEIDKNAFPCVYDWFTALQSYTIEERSCFPVSQIVHRSNLIGNSYPRKRIFQSPAKGFSQNFLKFQMKPSLLTGKF